MFLGHPDLGAFPIVEPTGGFWATQSLNRRMRDVICALTSSITRTGRPDLPDRGSHIIPLFRFAGRLRRVPSLRTRSSISCTRSTISECERLF